MVTTKAIHLQGRSAGNCEAFKVHCFLQWSNQQIQVHVSGHHRFSSCNISFLLMYKVLKGLTVSESYIYTHLRPILYNEIHNFKLWNCYFCHAVISVIIYVQIQVEKTLVSYFLLTHKQFIHTTRHDFCCWTDTDSSLDHTCCTGSHAEDTVFEELATFNRPRLLY